MSKFKVGQEVIFSHGDLEDVKGVILNPHFQISQSDWPEVVVQYGDDRRFFVDIDKVRPAEDPYEYNIERTSGITGRTSMCFGMDGWDDDREAVEGDFKDYLEGDGATMLGAKFRMVKRRKAGPVEDV